MSDRSGHERADRLSDDLAVVADISAVTKILETVSQVTGLRFAAVARVTEQAWTAMAVRDGIGLGLVPGGELPLQTTICDEIRQSRRMVVIDDVEQDDLFRDHVTPRLYGFRSYISVPIVLTDGHFFGTLCALDPQPAELRSEKILNTFTLFAELLAMHIAERRQLFASQAALVDERRTSELREQFIAVLGHDLRNPLAAIDSGARLLTRTALRPQDIAITKRIRSSVDRMARLIDDVLDLARVRLGGGMPTVQAVDGRLEALLQQIVSEFRDAWPDREIIIDIDLSEPVRCDGARIAQLVSNLIGNALTHGAPDTPVQTQAHARDGKLVIAVTNAGPRIPDAVRAKLFEPFSRGGALPGQQGLGLGLYIAAEIARAHGGSLSVRSDDGETCFTFEMPTA